MSQATDSYTTSRRSFSGALAALVGAAALPATSVAAPAAPPAPVIDWRAFDLDLGCAWAHRQFMDDEVAAADRQLQKWTKQNPWPAEHPDSVIHRAKQTAHAERFCKAREHLGYDDLMRQQIAAHETHEFKASMVALIYVTTWNDLRAKSRLARFDGKHKPIAASLVAYLQGRAGDL